MVKLCARGSAILAELSRLSDHVPKVLSTHFTQYLKGFLSIKYRRPAIPITYV
jgi:hypothetical protein